VLTRRGFSVIELMIAILIVGILASLAFPSFVTMMENLKIRTVTESLLAGTQLARAEAVRRNANVEFALNPGNGWTVSVGGATIQSRPANETNTQVIAVTVTPAGATKLTFNSLGRATANADASASITQFAIDSTVIPSAKSKDLQIVIGTGGSVRMCDPNLASSDPRGC